MVGSLVKTTCLFLVFVAGCDSQKPSQKYAGVKYGTVDDHVYRSKIEFLNIKQHQKFKTEELFAYKLRLSVIEGKGLPSAMILEVTKDNKIWSSQIPNQRKIGDNIYVCSGEIRMPSLPGQYRLIVECRDIIDDRQLTEVEVDVGSSELSIEVISSSDRSN